MDFEVVYPKVKNKSIFMSYFRYVCGWLFLTAGVVCPVVNLVLGGQAWSVIVLWSMYIVWTIVLKQPLVERNLISLGVRALVMVGILLVLIDRLIFPGWAAFVLPIFIYATLIALAVVFFSNISEQRHNVMPLITVIVLTVIGAAIALTVYSETRWPMIVLECVASALLIITIFILRMRLLTELRKRFHIEK